MEVALRKSRKKTELLACPSPGRHKQHLPSGLLRCPRHFCEGRMTPLDDWAQVTEGQLKNPPPLQNRRQEKVR